MPISPPLHRQAATAATAAPDRRSAAKRGYDRKWRQLRLIILQRDPLCVFCLPLGRLVPSHQVDHIQTIEMRPDLRLDPLNLRGLCDSCHSARTAAFEAKTAKTTHFCR